MKIPFKERAISTMVVVPSVIIVIALGVLQYRWSARVSEATAVRLADSLQMSMVNWQMDFFRYFSEISLALRIDPSVDAPGDVNQYVRRFTEWKSVAKYPDLVSAVYVLSTDHQPLRLNLSDRKFEPETGPSPFQSVLRDLENTHNLGRNVFDAGNPASGWWFDPQVPALFHLVAMGASTNWLAIQLSRKEIEQRILPDLVQTYFQGTEGLDYQVAVVSKTQPSHLLYSSDQGFGFPEPSDADGTIDIFGRVQDKTPVRVFHMPSDKGTSASVRVSWFPLLRKPVDGSDWRLVVRHRRGGPLGAFVNEIGRRDLVIGFGVLLVLVINMAMLILTSHRAQRLAQLQMNFVTAVSHELKTPLTVIISGAENICNGVVDTKQQMIQYGSVIGKQARQLFGLVERILLFAATRDGKQHYTLAPLDVSEVIESAVASTAGLMEENHLKVDCEIAPGLPKIMGNATAVSQCLQNLITNAVKYGNGNAWLGIRAALSGEDREVRISVSDRGIGIGPEDLPHIFEPFYRSPTVRDAQIHGTGLGLPLSQSIAKAMGGRVGVVSTPGEGSTFTLYFPAVTNTAS